MKNASNKQGYERFLYHVRGYIKNLTVGDGFITFNLEPYNFYGSDMNIDGKVLPSITLIGSRLIKTKYRMAREKDVVPVLATTFFKCVGVPFKIQNGERHDLHIDEDEIHRIRSLIVDPNLVVNVKGIL